MTFQLSETSPRKKMHEWETIIDKGYNMYYMHRMAVPGGWLYADFKSMTFVPDPAQTGIAP
jgi:hypothetical protein